MQMNVSIIQIHEPTTAFIRFLEIAFSLEVSPYIIRVKDCLQECTMGSLKFPRNKKATKKIVSINTCFDCDHEREHNSIPIIVAQEDNNKPNLSS